MLWKGRRSRATTSGKPHVVLFHFGGAGVYRHECEAEVERGFDGFLTR